MLMSDISVEFYSFIFIFNVDKDDMQILMLVSYMVCTVCQRLLPSEMSTALIEDMMFYKF